MNTRTPILILVLAACAGLVPNLRGAATEWKTHSDAKYHFTMFYPADWTLKLPDTETRFFVTSPLADAQDRFRENVNCRVLAVGDDATPRKFEQEMLDAIKTQPEFNLVKAEFLPSPQGEAWECLYTFTVPATAERSAYHIKMIQHVMISKGVMFTLTFTCEAASYDRYVADAKRVISSFALE